MSTPRITKQPDNVNVNLYKSDSFMCSAHGFGLLKILWKRINYTLPATATITEEKSLNELSSTLKIFEAIGYYSGQYCCVAENVAGNVTSCTAKLHVKQSKLESI